MNALAVQQVSGFVDRMALHLRELLPGEVRTLDPEALAAFVRKGCDAAESWGIQQESHTERLLELLVSYPQLRRHPLPEWVAEIVRYPGRSGEHKLWRLEDALIFGGAQ